jgi:choline kinase
MTPYPINNKRRPWAKKLGKQANELAAMRVGFFQLERLQAMAQDTRVMLFEFLRAAP